MKYIWPPLIHAIEERQKKIADLLGGLSYALPSSALALSLTLPKMIKKGLQA